MPISSIIFQIIIILLVPTLSIVNLQMIDQIKELALPDKKRLYFQSSINQIILTIIALWAAYHSEITIHYIGDFSNKAIIGGFVFLFIGFLNSYVTINQKDINDLNPGLDLLKPNTFSEKISWVVVNIVAAICEEIIFRGVLFYLFMQTTDSFIASAILSAVVFGFSHSVQGIMGITITTLFGIALQYLARINHGLALAMIVHFIYNMGTTFLVLNKKERNED